MIDVTELFCKVDDFYQGFEGEYKKHLIKSGQKRDRKSEITVSEIVTIFIMFHQLPFRHFKGLYTQYVSMGLLQNSIKKQKLTEKIKELVIT